MEFKPKPKLRMLLLLAQDLLGDLLVTMALSGRSAICDIYTAGDIVQALKIYFYQQVAASLLDEDPPMHACGQWGTEHMGGQYVGTCGHIPLSWHSVVCCHVGQ